MTESQALAVVITAAQPGLFAWMAALAWRLLNKLDRDTDRLHVNHSLRAGLALFGLASAGIAVLLLRGLTLAALPAWAGVLDLPSEVIRAVGTVVLGVLAYGAYLIVRGVKAIIYGHAKDGELPNLLKAVFGPLAAALALALLGWRH
jgi:hypothetical protein